MSKQNELLPVKSESLNKTEILMKYVYFYDIMMIKLDTLLRKELLEQYKK